MKAHIINRFIAITAVAWLGQAGAETNTRHNSLTSNSTSYPAATSASNHPMGAITLPQRQPKTTALTQKVGTKKGPQ